MTLKAFGSGVFMIEFATPVSHCAIVSICVDTQIIEVVMTHGTDTNLPEAGSFDSIEIRSVGSVPEAPVTSI